MSIVPSLPVDSHGSSEVPAADCRLTWNSAAPFSVSGCCAYSLCRPPPGNRSHCIGLPVPCSAQGAAGPGAVARAWRRRPETGLPWPRDEHRRRAHWPTHPDIGEWRDKRFLIAGCRLPELPGGCVGLARPATSFTGNLAMALGDSTEDIARRRGGTHTTRPPTPPESTFTNSTLKISVAPPGMPP